MKRLIGALMFVFTAMAFGSQRTSPSPTPSFEIQKPTIVAFFPPVTEAELEANPDTNEVLSDFQFYACAVIGPLQRSGIDFEVATARAFEIHIRGKVHLFQTGKIGVGYYFLAPRKKAHVEYGVMTDADIFAAAEKYFGIAVGM